MKINDPNKKGTIYYGTEYKYINELDQFGLESPRHRDEQFISISISGYEGKIKCEHPELKEFARVYSEELKIAKFIDGYLSYKNGYANSLTCIEGFGPSPNLFFNSMFGLIENSHSKDLVTVVLSDKAGEYSAFPDKEREFEHFSLALHGFIKKIEPYSIIGWIVADENVNELINKMSTGEMKKREVWSVKIFEKLNFDIEHRARYGYFPSDVNMYLENVNGDNFYCISCKEHLKNILQEVIPNDINWDVHGNILRNNIKKWWDGNREKTVWDSNKYRYKWR